MKRKTVRKNSKSNRKIVELRNSDISCTHTHFHDHSLSLLDTGTSINMVELIYLYGKKPPSPPY